MKNIYQSSWSASVAGEQTYFCVVVIADSQEEAEGLIDDEFGLGGKLTHLIIGTAAAGEASRIIDTAT